MSGVRLVEEEHGAGFDEMSDQLRLPLCYSSITGIPSPAAIERATSNYVAHQYFLKNLTTAASAG